MSNTRLSVAAIPVITFIGAEVASALLFGTSTTFWMETAFSLATLALLIWSLLWRSKKNLSVLGISNSMILSASFAAQLMLYIIGSALGDAALPGIPLLSLLVLCVTAALLFAGRASTEHARTVE